MFSGLLDPLRRNIGVRLSLLYALIFTLSSLALFTLAYYLFAAAISNKDREVLEARYAELAQRWAEGEVPVPDFWGGYLGSPETVEFWQGRANRLHDRLRYLRTEEGWQLDRLSP